MFDKAGCARLQQGRKGEGCSAAGMPCSLPEEEPVECWHKFLAEPCNDDARTRPDCRVGWKQRGAWLVVLQELIADI